MGNVSAKLQQKSDNISGCASLIIYFILSLTPKCNAKWMEYSVSDQSGKNSEQTNAGRRLIVSCLNPSEADSHSAAPFQAEHLHTVQMDADLISSDQLVSSEERGRWKAYIWQSGGGRGGGGRAGRHGAVLRRRTAGTKRTEGER